MIDFEYHLSHSLDHLPSSRVKEAMLYSLCAPGKRIRPQLLLNVLASYGMDQEIGLRVACAIEMVHVYSLIHDDLPCMDNDDLRRGRPTCHIQFDEASAVLAGDALLTEAFYQVSCTQCEDAIKNKMILLFSQLSGAQGMILGQNYDLALEKASHVEIDQCLETDYYKTGCLLTLPLLCGALLANHEEDCPIWEKIGYDLGLAFQIQDDILDVLSNEATMGKSLSDSSNNKKTYVMLLGIEQAQKKVAHLFDEIETQILQLNIQHDLIFNMIQTIKNRKH